MSPEDFGIEWFVGDDDICKKGHEYRYSEYAVLPDGPAVIFAKNIKFAEPASDDIAEGESHQETEGSDADKRDLLAVYRISVFDEAVKG